MPQQVNSPRAAGQLRDELELQGRVPLQADETIVPVVNVGGDFPDHVFPLQASGRAWGFFDYTPGATFNVNGWLLNPAGSGTIAHVHTLIHTLVAGASPILQGIRLGISGSFSIGAVGNAEPADTRRGDAAGTNNAILEWHAADGGVIANPEHQLFFHAAANEGLTTVIPVDFVLAPGTAMFMCALNADQRLQMNAQWVERPARRAEQQEPG